jgi:hypothetical protein
MNVTVTSMDNEEKALKIQPGSGSQTLDIHLATDGYGFSSVHLVAPMHVARNFSCPLYNAVNSVCWMFAHNKQDALHVKAGDAALFSLDPDSVITFAVPEFVSNIPRSLDFMRSTKGFFGIRARLGHGHDARRTKTDAESVDAIAWLSGPDNADYADYFGHKPYQKRRALFGNLYDMAAADPIQMANPLFLGTDWKHYIIKGRQP